MKYPINLDVTGRKCAVLGGGKVALRKIRGLLQAGAKVEVTAPEFCREILALADAGEVELVKKKYTPGILPDAFIFVAATNDPRINKLAAEEARAKKILVNDVDGGGDFDVPSRIRRGEFLLTISTGESQSPAFARFVREMLEDDFPENFGAALETISKFRERLKQTLPEPETRREFWRKFFTPELWAAIKRGELDELEKKFNSAPKGKE